MSEPPRADARIVVLRCRTDAMGAASPMQRRLFDLAEILERDRRATPASPDGARDVENVDPTFVDVGALVAAALAAREARGPAIDVMSGSGPFVSIGDERVLAGAIGGVVSTCVECTPGGTTLHVRLGLEPGAVFVDFEHEVRVGFDEEGCEELHAARRTCVAHGGSLVARVDRDLDSRIVTLRLPRADGSSETPVPPLFGVRALVIVDDDEQRRRIRQLLRSNGAKTLGTRETRLALPFVQGFDPHVVVATEDVGSLALPPDALVATIEDMIRRGSG